MAQPTAYSKTTNFANDESNNVGGRSSVRTSNLDAEFRNIETTLGQTLRNLALLQRDDGKLRDAYVEYYNLSSQALAALQARIVPRGLWATSVQYSAYDLVDVSGEAYVCATAHTSGVFATDYAAGKWQAFNANDLSNITFTQDDLNAVARTSLSKQRDIINVHDFAAVGDGATNDTTALRNASAKITALGGGALWLNPGKTYLVGQQDFAGTTGAGYAYRSKDVIKITGCTKPVVIEGSGAKLKLASGLKFGSFNPTTGAVYTPGGLPFTNADYYAEVGEMIELQNNASVTVRDLELDGNIQNITLGGQFGDTGYQCAGYGIWAYSNAQLLLQNVYSHHHALDGVAIGYSGLTSATNRKPHTLINVRSHYNARQGLTWTGGNALTAINCSFSYTGQSTFASSPSSGVDIEAESGAYCQGGHFIDCEMIDNQSTAMVADSGVSRNITFYRCIFLSRNSAVLWPAKEGYTFRECRIYGALLAQYGSTDPLKQNKFIDCLFSDETVDGLTPWINGGVMFASALSAPVLYDRCTFKNTRSKPGRLDFATARRCCFLLETGTEVIADQDWLIQGGGGWWEDNTFITNVTNAPASGYTLMVTAGTEVFRGQNLLTNSGAGVARWNSWNTASGGYVGYYGESYEYGASAKRVPQHALSLAIEARRDAYQGAQNHYSAFGAVPSGVTVNKGDIFWNANCGAGGIPGWMVTTGGVTGSTAVTKAMAAVAA